MEIDEITGLSSFEVARKQQEFGYNVLPNKEHKNIFRIIVSLATEPMIFLLLITVAIYFSIGDKGEAFLLLLSVFGIVGIELYQESKTEKSLEALRNLSSPIASVIRDGQHFTIPGRELVVGDTIIISEGSRVPADAKLISETQLTIDESLLTGESVSVEKTILKTDDKRQNQIYSGTLVVKGHGVAIVTSIGQNTEIGNIGKSLSSIETEKTLLQKEVTKVVKVVATIAISVSILLTLAYWIIKGNFVSGLLAGLTLSISILPEEFPVVLTLFLTLGAWRLAKNNILTRKANTIETLGSATVLCVDKTGTLTQNKMKIMAIADTNGNIIHDTIPTNSEIIKYGVLASQKKPFDPMESAFIQAGEKSYGSVKTIYRDTRIIKEYPLDENSLSIVHVWGKNKNETSAAVAIKGAPEVVFDLCHLADEEKVRLSKCVNEMASFGLRIIAVAKGKNIATLPENRQDFELEFLGLVGLADPIREEAPVAVKTCQEAGIRVIMITGDYPQTALQIARQVGLTEGDAISGAEFEALSDTERRQVIKNISIFSRVSPSNKLTIVKALKASGEIVAMTGDGVNDAPALKAANIGVAMGKNGTDVAREAATIVLLDDNFNSIVRGVRLGRRIYDNLQKAMAYIFAVHVPIAILSLVPVFFGWPPILFPAHIVFLEFIIDPSSTIIFENEKEDSGIMKRPPRKLSSPIFSKRMIIGSLVQGLFVAVFLVATYALLIQLDYSHDKARSMLFLSLIVSNLLMVIGISGKRAFDDIFHRENKAMIAIFCVAIVALVVVYSVPSIRHLFQFTQLTMVGALLSILIGTFSIVGIAPLRYLVRRLYNHSTT